MGMNDDIIAKASWQNFVDNLQRLAMDANSKGKRFLTMDHPYHLMSSSFVNSHVDVPGRKTWPKPSVVDHKLNVAADELALEREKSEHENEFDLRVQPNPTLIPDRFFFSFTPIITIRHPAHATPSAYRALQEMGADISNLDFPVATSYRLTRLVFDSLKSYAEMRVGRRDCAATVTMPIVVDGGKLVKDPQGQMKKVCDILGLDEGGIRYNWDKPEILRGTKMGDAFFKTLNESNGVVPNPKYDKPVDVETEARKWAQEWDEDTAKLLRERVLESLEDYHYLLQYSV
ncbi:hypothetical protein PM082_021334 [Marasmius tenuissimus]|nr:hypothetical protein PM082_021334 [Marasmius tenuissimus]